MSKTALDSSIYKVEANRFKNSWSVETSNANIVTKTFKPACEIVLVAGVGY